MAASRSGATKESRHLSLCFLATTLRCIEVFENISDAAVVATCLPASKEYWIVGKLISRLAVGLSFGLNVILVC